MTGGTLAKPLGRPYPFAFLAAIPLVLLTRDWIYVLTAGDLPWFGMDFVMYRDAAAQWLADGHFYHARQLTGQPYWIVLGDILYPPPTLLLFVPFTVLPAALFWIIPITVTVWVVWHHRPKAWVWPVLALALWFPATSVKVLTGNPVMWMVMLVALGTIRPVFAPFALGKLSLFPFAFVRSNTREWWVGFGLVLLCALAFLPMWPDYARVMLDQRDAHGLLYSIQEVPMVLIPVIAWLGRAKP